MSQNPACIRPHVGAPVTLCTLQNIQLSLGITHMPYGLIWPMALVNTNIYANIKQLKVQI